MMNQSFDAWRLSVRGLFSAKAIDEAKRHARREFPKESCGLIVSGEYVPCHNYADDPLSDFMISPTAYLRASKEGTIEAVVHSHPNGQPFPSALDMEQQIQTAVPWLIFPLNDSVVLDPVAFGDQLPVAPLLGRPFVWGVFDCYSLIRDYYKLHYAISLPNVPREDEWWNRGQDLYRDHLAPAGFRVIDRRDAKPGDGFLCKFLSADVLNHAGLLIENDQILHHLPARVSRREASGIWGNAADLWVRHEALNG